MRQFALLTVLLVMALPVLAHDDEKRQIYLLERKVERLEHRIDRLEIMLGRNALSPADEKENLTPEQQKLFDCQLRAKNAEEMQECAKFIPEAKGDPKTEPS